MPRLPRFLVVLLALAPSLAAQPFTEDARRMGYLHRADTTWFVFDAGAYGLQPQRVVVTGAFRGWNQDMNAADWQLRSLSSMEGVWVLPVPNANYATIGPATPFKFRVDEGRWLDPPVGAPNAAGGNLVFLHDRSPVRLRAELRAENVVWVELPEGAVAAPFSPDTYRLVDARGAAIPIARVLPHDATHRLVVPARPLDVGGVYYVEVPEQNLRALARLDGIFRTLYSDKPLGAEVEGDSTVFRVFSPRAAAVRLYLYRDRAGAAYDTLALERDRQGVWETAVAGDLAGVYYDFTVHGGARAGEPGTYFYETNPVHATDPYARVSDDSWGRARVWHRGVPPPPVAGGRPALADVVAYEVHVQDFTDALPLPDSLRGTFRALATPGLRNRRGQPVGFDYLVDLGINTVHLMPVQEFLHYPDSLWQRAFAGDAYAQMQGIDRENYQWGYRTTHAFALESRFRTRGAAPGRERDQFRDLVAAFHREGIAVIVDLVPNHTGENMDGGHFLFNFNVFDKAYYYRLDDAQNHIGPFGNEVKFEERPLVQRWLIDQCRALMDEMGVDGFRIDLAGQVDEASLRALRAALPADAIIYGEPWIPPSDPDVAANPDWAWYKADAPITFFQDDARNAFKGPTSNPESKATDRGWAGGDAAQRARVMLGLTNAWPDEGDPDRGINYLDIHDNWALADQFATRDWNGLEGVDEGAFKIAAGLLMTSLGPVVLHGGTEIMRSKGSAPLVETVTPLPGLEGVAIAIHGKRDTYNLRRANEFRWETVGQTRGPDDFAAMQAYWRGLIALRLSPYGAPFRRGKAVPPDYYRWILPDDAHLLGYVVDGRVLVLANAGADAATFDIPDLPAGSWRRVADSKRVDASGLDGPDAPLAGGRDARLTVPSQSFNIWVRE